MILPTSEEIAHRINKSFEDLFVQDKDGNFCTPVCAICDTIIDPKKRFIIPLDWLLKPKKKQLLQPEAWQHLDPDLIKCYQINISEMMNEGDPMNTALVVNAIDGLILSPRATYVQSFKSKKKSGLTSCNSCGMCIQTDNLPARAIKNNYLFGDAPSCITDLNDYELAFLSPVRQFGYCFSYNGGPNRCLQGSLQFFKVKPSSIARAIAQLDVLGLRKDVVVVLYGDITKEQRRKVKDRAKLRVEKVIEAVEWLVKHNSEWKSHDGKIDMNLLRDELLNAQPIFVDGAKLHDGNETAANNVEEEETFRVFFPDGSVNPENGGQGNVEDFKEMIKTAREKGYDMQYQCDFSRESVMDFRDNALVNACLLQFPFGRGGMHEDRLKKDGTFSVSVDADSYIEHLSRLSPPQFHRDRFTLILYNMSMRRMMLQRAFFKVRNDLTASQISTSLTEEDIANAISKKKTGDLHNNNAGGSFIRAVDAVAQAVPHSNDATRKARRDGQTFAHHFGFPSFFLTVVPDDLNSFYILVYSANANAHKAVDPANMTDQELKKFATLREKIRMEYPGICAFYFEQVLDIVIEQVLGWDQTNGRPTERPGLFGVPIAYIAAMEEQGRKTLHTHILVWIKGFSDIQENIHSSDSEIANRNKRKLEQLVDAVVTSELISKKHCAREKFMTVNGAFQHKCCTASGRPKKAPRVVDDQSLRNLRNRKGRVNCGGAFAYCPQENCCKVWTSESLLSSYLTEGVKIPNMTQLPDDCKRLKTMLLCRQVVTNAELMPSFLVNAAHNFHEHTTSCFKKTTKTKRKKAGTSGEEVEEEIHRGDECRYRYPKRPKCHTKVEDSTDKEIKWYNWTGTFTYRKMKEVNLKRHKYDSFVNENCKAISMSQIACNTNLAAIFPGPVGGYIFKYQTKDNQEDDTEAYQRVQENTRKALEARKHESDKSESLRRILAASYAHQKTGIVGSSMAAYLTRNKTRFRYSHETTWCPLRDITSLLTRKTVHASISHGGGRVESFFVCMALHYLCRPSALETLSVQQFYSKYEVVRVIKENRSSLLPFQNTQEFTHPSYDEKTGLFRQGVRERVTPTLAKTYERDFPDPSTFDGNILSDTTPLTLLTEKYAKQVLMFFTPYRTLTDLMEESSFVIKLRSIVLQDKLSPQAKQILQNITNTAYNAWRIKNTQDDLQRHSMLQAPHEFEFELFPEDAEEEIETDKKEIEFETIEELLKQIDETMSDTASSKDIPTKFDGKTIKGIGSHMAGYEYLSQITLPREYSRDFITCQDNTSDGQTTANESRSRSGPNPRQRDVAYLIINRRSRKTRTFVDITKSQTPLQIMEANGTAASILDWAKQSGIDKYQRRAFEVFCATFVLTFHKSNEDTAISPDERSALRREANKLKKLAGITRRRKEKQLVCLLYGPGGSGKSACVDLLMLYAKEYCENFENGFNFTTQTIVVTALTGVAATILKGETVHTALHLNSRKLDIEHIEVWEATRMLIIDEISFCDKKTMQKINDRLCRLRQNLTPFGGVNIVFSGDFRQLEPFGNSKPLYEERCDIFENSINCYLELKGMHRFAGDKEFGKLLGRIRDGDIRDDDIETINTRWVENIKDPLPNDLKYATHDNKDRDSINAALFEDRCREAMKVDGTTGNSVIIFSDHIRAQVQPHKYTEFNNYHHFWQHCSESHIEAGAYNPRMDPVLRLYEGCPVMVPENICVSLGQANGTRARFEKVVLKAGERSTTVMYEGMYVQGVKAGQVDHVVVRHERNDIEPATFRLKPKENTFKANLLMPELYRTKEGEREKLKMKAVQVPLIVNHATTGHKLQGATVDRLFVHCWKYAANWPYVVLSRVTTLDGLYLRRPLENNKSFAVPSDLKQLIKRMEMHKPEYFTDEQYEEILHHTGRVQ